MGEDWSHIGCMNQVENDQNQNATAKLSNVLISKGKRKKLIQRVFTGCLLFEETINDMYNGSPILRGCSRLAKTTFIVFRFY